MTVPMSLPVFSRPEFEQAVVGVIGRKRGLWHPTAYIARIGGREVVWKDMGGAPWLFRLPFRPVLRREARALVLLDGKGGAPRCLGLVGRDGFAMEKIEGQRLPHLHENDLDEAFFDALLAELRDMHSLGVAHGDLRRKNILIEDATRRPRFIDFGTAIVLGPNPGALRKSLWRKACRIDRLHYAKLKEYYLPGSLTEEEKAWLAHAPWHYRLGRFLRGRLYRPLKWRNVQKAVGKRRRQRLKRKMGPAAYRASRPPRKPPSRRTKG